MFIQDINYKIFQNENIYYYLAPNITVANDDGLI